MMSKGYIQSTYELFKHLISLEDIRLEQMSKIMEEMAKLVENEKTRKYAMTLVKALQAESKIDMMMIIMSFILKQDREEWSGILTEIQNISITFEEWMKSGDLTFLNETLEWILLRDEWIIYWKEYMARIWKEIKLDEVGITPAIMIQTSILFNGFLRGNKPEQKYPEELVSFWDSKLRNTPKEGRPVKLASFFCFLYILFPLIFFFDSKPYEKLLTATLVVELGQYKTRTEKIANFKKSVKKARTLADRLWEKGSNTVTPSIESKWWKPIEKLLV